MLLPDLVLLCNTGNKVIFAHEIALMKAFISTVIKDLLIKDLSNTRVSDFKEIILWKNKAEFKRNN